MFSDDVVVRLLRDRYRAFERLDGIEPGEWAEARMLGRPALVVRGREGVRTFYDASLVTRRGGSGAGAVVAVWPRRGARAERGRASASQTDVSRCGEPRVRGASG